MFTKRTLSVGGAGLITGVAPVIALPANIIYLPMAILGLVVGISLYIWYLNDIGPEPVPQDVADELSLDEDQVYKSDQ